MSTDFEPPPRQFDGSTPDTYKYNYTHTANYRLDMTLAVAEALTPNKPKTHDTIVHISPGIYHIFFFFFFAITTHSFSLVRLQATVYIIYIIYPVHTHICTPTHKIHECHTVRIRMWLHLFHKPNSYVSFHPLISCVATENRKQCSETLRLSTDTNQCVLGLDTNVWFSEAS